MNPLETYLTRLREIRSSGSAVKEISYYSALENLFNEIGKTLKPQVRCNMQLKNQGAGNPDGGLFTVDQLKSKRGEDKPLPQTPARGVVEVKSTADDAWVTVDSEQVSRYWTRYHQVLVTNYRDFVFIGQDSSGKAVKLEKYRLADSEPKFWEATHHPKKTADLHGAMFIEFAKRAMLHAAPLSAPEDLAWFLASYARDALARIGLHELPALATVRKALEEALGLTFEGEKGEHFFRSTLVQTLFYGVFSAWVLWAKTHPPTSKDRFDWKLTSYLLKVPVLRKLFHEVADPGQLEDLNLSEILDWTSAVLNRVDRASFFSKFQEAHAVQYFYEPFLEAFDPELRKQLGVWYTPPEIVQYMVARVDTVLREELGLPDGLAEKNVYVLDPCCGTGSYLVEVLNRIHQTLQERGGDALIAADIKEAAQNRVFGFEILPAPFVVAHLQLGLLLQNFGAPLAEKGSERVGIYLTNALTGWEPPKEPKKRLLFPELQDERDAAEHVKRDTPILVILGNPPYNGFAGVAVQEERELSTAYRTTKKAPPPQGQGLNDLYVRFYRMAEHRIAEMSGYGVVCFISNYSWLDGLSFTGMRESYLEKFDQLWIDNLHGDRIISEYAPTGETSETVFATQGTSPGIKIGTAIALLAKKKGGGNRKSLPLYRDLNEPRAAARRQALLASLSTKDYDSQYQPLTPVLDLGFALKPGLVGANYLNWPVLTALFPLSFPGVKTSRDKLLVDFDKKALLKRIEGFFDKEISYQDWGAENPGLIEKTNRFDPRAVRDYLTKRGMKPENIVRYQYRPFDVRWLYWEPETKLLDEKRLEYFPQVKPGNVWLTAGQRNRKEDFYRPQLTTVLADHHIVESNVGMFPLTLTTTADQARLYYQPHHSESPNISNEATEFLQKLKGTPEELFYSTLATLNSPRYTSDNAGALRQDWPRIPVPSSNAALAASAELGRQLAVLFDTESRVNGVDTGAIRNELKLLAVATRSGGGNLKESDLKLEAGWGHAGKGGVTMPGKGKLLERDYSPVERKSILDGISALGLFERKALGLLGEKTCDVYLNDIAYWSNIPKKVWDYTIGGYQVIKKWLSYREQPLLGRALTIDEVRYVQEMARRIAAILLLQPALDANYESIKQHTYPWPQKGEAK
jgi:hypothetical protein